MTSEGESLCMYGHLRPVVNLLDGSILLSKPVSHPIRTGACIANVYFVYIVRAGKGQPNYIEGANDLLTTGT